MSTLASVRNSVFSFAGTIVFSTVLVAAAVLPAQTVVAATLGL